MIALWVALGAVVGAPARYLTDRAVSARVPSRVPLGTLAVNLIACLVLGVVTGASGAGPTTVALIGTGFCGALSTWSTFAAEVVGLASRRERAVAAGYAALSIVAGVGVAGLGWVLVS